jgi:hypothetical protein
MRSAARGRRRPEGPPSRSSASLAWSSASLGTGRGSRPAGRTCRGAPRHAIKDPFGHKWSLAEAKTQLTPEEIQQGQKAFFAQMAASGGSPKK